MEEKSNSTSLASRLLRGEKVLCKGCGQDYYVTDAKEPAKGHFFYCPKCDYYINIDPVIDIE